MWLSIVNSSVPLATNNSAETISRPIDAIKSATFLVIGFLNSLIRSSKFEDPLARHAKRCACMTAATVLECKITAEGTPSVVTAQATLSRGGKVFSCVRRANLFALRQSGREGVTGNAIEPLPRSMFGVTERSAKSTGVS